jgi:hypothetical protein
MSAPVRASASRRAAFTAAFLLPLLILGCAGKGNVSGKVTYKGTPLPYGNVQIQSGNGTIFVAEIKEDGSYSVSGVPTGSCKVAVSCVDPAAVDFAKAMSAAGKDTTNKAKMPKGSLEDFNKIPARYADFSTSGLTLELKSGDQTFDIKLE